MCEESLAWTVKFCNCQTNTEMTFPQTLCHVYTSFVTSATLNNFYYFASLIYIKGHVPIEKALVV